MGKGLGRVALVVDQPRFLFDPVVDQADIQPAFRHLELRLDKFHPVRIAVDNGRGLNRVLHHLETDPDPGKPAERIGIDAVIEDFLHARRADHRHVAIDQRPFALVENGRGLAGVIVAKRHQHAAIRAGPGHVGMAHHVARPVDARSLAVPEAEDAVELALAAQLGLLTAPKGRGRQIFVQTRLELHIASGQHRLGPRHLHVDRAKRRAAITGDVSGGVQSRFGIACLLHQHQSNQSLGTVHEDRRFFQIVTVLKAYLMFGHSASPLADACSQYRRILGHNF